MGVNPGGVGGRDPQILDLGVVGGVVVGFRKTLAYFAQKVC